MRIVISGTVGIGKSTTSNEFVKRLREMGKDVSFLKEETVDSPYLSYYYDSPADWAFVAQIDFLLGRFKQWLTDERDRAKAGKKHITVYDRHFLDDYVFAELHTIKNNISNFNSLTYQALYKELLEKMSKMDSKPTYFVMLKAPIDVVMSRLNKRGREEEKEVDLKYWEDLYNNYYNRSAFQNHFKSNSKNFIEIDTTDKSTKEIVDEIIEKCKIK